MKKDKSSSQKKEKENKSKARKTRNLFNRIFMGLLVLFFIIGVVYSIKSIRPVNLLESGNHPFKGNSAAKVIVSEFSDFQCPACKGAEVNMKKLLADYPDKIKLVFYHYPLSANHPWAMLAAEASECANDQGQFWPLHDLLYDRQEIWSKDSAPSKLFKGYAAELGIKAEPFNTCLDQGKKKSVIAEDQGQGDALQIQSTPTIFINQQRIIGGNSYPDLKQAVESEINLRS
ncbi:MAG: DsbA family protein [Nitrospirae bacterium]|nr:DsbA family protein [Nitrospirota bacterium]